MATVSPILANLARTIIAHNRLEPRPRSAEFNRGLRAEVRDAAWLLARQWQLKEFRAEDRGSPAFADLTVRTARPTRLQLGVNPAQLYEPATPWEAQLQAQAPLIDDGLRLRMGQAWLGLLRQQGLGRLAPDFRARFPLGASPEPAAGEYNLAFAQAQTTEVQAILQAAGARALDGYALFEALRADGNAAVLLTGPPVDEAARAALAQLATNYLSTYGRLYFNRPATSAWSVPDLSYDYALAVPDAAAPVLLAGQTPAGTGLQWHCVDEAAPVAYPALATGAVGTAGNAPEIAPVRFIPTEIEFTGAPASRWWDFEDHRVDFGQVTGGSSDFGRMLLQEFVFLYQNDWFSVPYSVPVGSLSTVKEVVVTDVFGQTYRVHAAGASPATEPGAPERKLDDDAGRWSLFGQSPTEERTAPVPRLLLPNAALTPLVGRPVERVTLLREEATNLVWAVEQTIPDGMGGGMDGASAAARVTDYLRNRASPPPAATTAAYTYQLASSVAEHWIPFVARPAATGLLYLEQGEIARQVAGLALRPADQTVQPRTPLLQQGAGQPYLIHEYLVPPAGVQLEGAYRRARGLDGSVALWYGYQRLPAKPAGGSGLQFDTLLPPGSTPSSPASAVAGEQIQPMPYQQNQLFNLNRYDQYLVLPLPALPTLTVAFWVNVADEAFIGSWRYLLDARNLRDNTWFASLGIGADWTWYLDGISNTAPQLSGVLSLNTWHHVVLTSGGATQAGDLLLNARFTRNEYISPVRYADLRIYARPLLPREIADPTGSWSSDGLVAHLTLEEGPRVSTTTVQAIDKSGNGNHGILQGF